MAFGFLWTPYGFPFWRKSLLEEVLFGNSCLVISEPKLMHAHKVMEGQDLIFCCVYTFTFLQKCNTSLKLSFAQKQSTPTQPDFTCCSMMH